MMGYPPNYSDTNSPARIHSDGSICKCEPSCNCHPPLRKEDNKILERGSFHLETCPVFLNKYLEYTSHGENNERRT